MVVPARRPARPAQDLAPQRRPRRRRRHRTRPRALYKLAENRWFDYWLFGVENGITDEPRLTIQREDGSYHHEADWPARGARTARLRLSADSATAPGRLTTRRGGASGTSRSSTAAASWIPTTC